MPGLQLLHFHKAPVYSTVHTFPKITRAMYKHTKANSKEYLITQCSHTLKKIQCHLFKEYIFLIHSLDYLSPLPKIGMTLKF